MRTRRRMNPSGVGSSSFAGFGLIEVMISIGVLSIVMMGVVSIGTIVMKQQRQSNLLFQTDNARRSIVNALNSPAAWKSTVMDPLNNKISGPMLDCLPTAAPLPTQPGYVCTTDGFTNLPAGVPIAGREIKRINDIAGNLVYDASAPNIGLTAQGLRCTTFVDPVNGVGNDDCPLRFRVVWTAICTTTCVDPQVQLQILAVYNPSALNRISFNPANYGTPTFIQGQSPGGGATPCWTLAGTMLYETCAAMTGIGTMTPVAALEVSANGTGSTLPNFPAIRISNTNAGANSYSALQVYAGNASVQGQIQTQNGPIPNSANGAFVFWAKSLYTPMVFFTNDSTYTEKMRLASNGYLGIGTTNPQATLDVNGDLLLPNETNRLYFKNNGGSRGGSIYEGNGNNINIVLDSGGYLKILTGYSIAAVISSTGTYTPSDRRLKTKIEPLDGVLARVAKIDAVSYEWKSDQRKHQRHIGVIAQDLQKAFPELVDEIDNPDEKSPFRKILLANYENLTAVVLQGLKELQTLWASDSQALHARIDELTEKNRALELRLEALEKQHP